MQNNPPAPIPTFSKTGHHENHAYLYSRIWTAGSGHTRAVQMMTTYPLTTLEHIKSTTRISWPSVLLLLVSFCCCCQLAVQPYTVYLSDIMPEITQICSTDSKRKETDVFSSGLVCCQFSSSANNSHRAKTPLQLSSFRPSRRHSSTLPACWSVFWTQEVFAGL